MQMSSHEKEEGSTQACAHCFIKTTHYLKVTNITLKTVIFHISRAAAIMIDISICCYATEAVPFKSELFQYSSWNDNPDSLCDYDNIS